MIMINDDGNDDNSYNFLCRIFGVKCDRCGVVLSPHDLVSFVIIVVIIVVTPIVAIIFLAIIIIAIVVIFIIIIIIFIMILPIILMMITGDANDGLYLSPWMLSVRYVWPTIAGIMTHLNPK